MSLCKKALTLLLVVSMLLPLFVACGETTETPSDTQPQGTVAEEVATEEVDPFEDVDYGGRAFNIYTSTNIACTGMGNSNYLIEGEKATTGNLVEDAVLERNVTVSEKLGVELVFTQINEPYNTIQDKIRILGTSGMHEYDLLINDLYPFANLSIEGQFLNILSDECSFDFSKDICRGCRSNKLVEKSSERHFISELVFGSICKGKRIEG